MEVGEIPTLCRNCNLLIQISNKSGHLGGKVPSRKYVIYRHRRDGVFYYKKPLRERRVLKMKKLILAVAGVLAIGGVAGVIATRQDPKEEKQSTDSSIVQQSDATELSYTGVEGVTALELLKQKHEVETDSFEGVGEFVVSIDGVKADSKHFWSFYVNGQQAQVGAGAYVSKDTDTISWKLEEIK